MGGPRGRPYFLARLVFLYGACVPPGLATRAAAAVRHACRGLSATRRNRVPRSAATGDRQPLAATLARAQRRQPADQRDFCQPASVLQTARLGAADILSIPGIRVFPGT